MGVLNVAAKRTKRAAHRTATALRSRQALVAAPLVVAVLVGSIVMASGNDPAKVETLDEAAAPPIRITSTSKGIPKRGEPDAAPATEAGPVAPKQATGTPAVQESSELTDGGLRNGVPPAADPFAGIPTAPPGESDKLSPAIHGLATPVDLTKGLIGPVPPVGWPAGTSAPLTGLGIDSPFGVAGPAVAVKVSNAPSAQPQTGLHLADLMYETPAHGIGDASRFLAIYHSRNVDTVGPVRSARTGDLPLLAPLGRPILAYAGANKLTQMGVELREKDGWLVHTHERKDGGPQFFRVGPKVTESNLFVSRNNLASKYGPLSAPPAQQFGWLGDGQWNAGSKPASRVDLQVAGQRSGFVYDVKSKQWVRFQSGRPHVNKTDGSQIGRSSVIVMTTAYQGSYADMDSMEAVTFPQKPGVPASGQVWVLTGRTYTQGTWFRDADKATFRLQDMNGRPIGLQRGPVYVGLVSTPPTIT